MPSYFVDTTLASFWRKNPISNLDPSAAGIAGQRLLLSPRDGFDEGWYGVGKNRRNESERQLLIYDGGEEAKK